MPSDDLILLLGAGGSGILMLGSIALVFIAGAAAFWFRKQLKASQGELADASERLQRYAPIMDVEAETARIQAENGTLERRLGQLQADILAANSTLQATRQQIIEAEEHIEMEVSGFYQPELDAMSSAQYAEQLKAIRAQQKTLIKEKQALICHSEWTVNGSKAEGRKQTNRLIKLGLSAFNTQVDNVILKVNFKNYPRSQEKIDKVAQNVAKLLETNSITISPGFINLKQQELRLAHRYAEKKQAEKEEQARIRDQMRAEEKALKEMEREKRQAEKEQQTYLRALEKARAEFARASSEAQQQLRAQLEALEAQLVAAEGKVKAISQAQLTKSGHVYVISNVGSFGEEVFKIGMTRRLEPEIRIRELSNASVPFSFDVHAMMYTEDAPALEKTLHNHFNDRRINKVNTRKEFFRVSLDEIEAAARQHHRADVEFTRVVEAKEYWLSVHGGAPEDNEVLPPTEHSAAS